MIELADKRMCCGCNACGDVCSKGAIRFELDDEGFLYPVVDKAKCVNCGLCDKVCPELRAKEMQTNEFVEPECWAAA